MDSYACVLPFDTDAREFARGVEIGRLWEALRRDSGEVTETVHAYNAEMLLRIAEATGRTVSSEDLDETWMSVAFGEAPETPGEHFRPAS